MGDSHGVKAGGKALALLGFYKRKLALKRLSESSLMPAP